MLTPLDIQNKDFSSGAVGYKKAEVDEFLGLLLKDYETMYKNNIDLNDKINMLNNALEHMNKAYILRKKIFGEDNSSTMSSLYRLASIYEKCRKYDVALKYYKKVWRIRLWKLNANF